MLCSFGMTLDLSLDGLLSLFCGQDIFAKACICMQRKERRRHGDKGQPGPAQCNECTSATTIPLQARSTPCFVQTAEDKPARVCCSRSCLRYYDQWQAGHSRSLCTQIKLLQMQAGKLDAVLGSLSLAYTASMSSPHSLSSAGIVVLTGIC